MLSVLQTEFLPSSPRCAANDIHGISSRCYWLWSCELSAWLGIVRLVRRVGRWLAGRCFVRSLVWIGLPFVVHRSLLWVLVFLCELWLRLRWRNDSDRKKPTVSKTLSQTDSYFVRRHRWLVRLLRSRGRALAGRRGIGWWRCRCLLRWGRRCRRETPSRMTHLHRADPGWHDQSSPSHPMSFHS